MRVFEILSSCVVKCCQSLDFSYLIFWYLKAYKIFPNNLWCEKMIECVKWLRKIRLLLVYYLERDGLRSIKLFPEIPQNHKGYQNLLNRFNLKMFLIMFYRYFSTWNCDRVYAYRGANQTWHFYDPILPACDILLFFK